MKNYKVLIVNGAPQAGKDTFIDMIQKSGRYNVIKTSIIDPMKDITNFLKFDTSNKTNKDRKLWADLLKTTMDYNNYPITKTIEHVEHKIQYMFGNKNTIICIIARNPKNIEIFKQKFEEKSINTTTIFINNEDKEKNIPDNPEDQSIYDYTYDLYIDNSSTLHDLEETVEFIDWMEI